MSMLKKLGEYEDERRRLKEGGGQKAIEKQHSLGKLTARERVEKLLDPGTFQEFNLWAKALKTGFDIDEMEIPGDAVITGYGEVNGRPICVYAHDFTVIGGSQAAISAYKVSKVMQTAVRIGVPSVGLIDSGGMRIQEGIGRGVDLSPLGGNLMRMVSPVVSSGVVPQISVMLGPCYAGSAYSSIMADFVIMSRPTTFMSLASPNLLKAVTFADVNREEIGSPKLHAQVTGSCDLLEESDDEALKKCRDLLKLLPSNNKERPPVIDIGDETNRRDDALLDVVPDDPSVPYDIHEVISRVVDSGYLLEIKPYYAMNITVGFARLGGRSVGVIGNNPMVLGGALDVNSSDKEARFIRFCDAFNIPLIFFVDTPGYLPGVDQDREGIIRHGAKVTYAICESTVPKITIYTGKCTGGGNLAVPAERMGGDLALAWPTSQLGLTEPDKAVDTIYKNEIQTAANPEEVRQRRIEQLRETYGKYPYSAAARALVDDIIDPRETRPLLIKALKRLSGKQQPPRPAKKHGIFPW